MMYRVEFSPDNNVASGVFVLKFILNNEKVITKQLILAR
jgi:hypothetical protein